MVRKKSKRVAQQVSDLYQPKYKDYDIEEADIGDDRAKSKSNYDSDDELYNLKGSKKMKQKEKPRIKPNIADDFNQGEYAGKTIDSKSIFNRNFENNQDEDDENNEQQLDYAQMLQKSGGFKYASTDSEDEEETSDNESEENNDSESNEMSDDGFVNESSEEEEEEEEEEDGDNDDGEHSKQIISDSDEDEIHGGTLDELMADSKNQEYSEDEESENESDEESESNQNQTENNNNDSDNNNLVPEDENKLDAELEQYKDEEQKMLQNLSQRYKEELSKAEGVKNQKMIWESFLKLRINLQKGLSASNRMPQHDIKEEFKASNNNIAQRYDECTDEMYSLMNDLLNLQQTLLPHDESSEKRPKKKQRLDYNHEKKNNNLTELWNTINDSYQSWKGYREDILNSTYRNTKLMSNVMGKHRFKSLNQDFTDQVKGALNQKNKLIQRSRTIRDQEKILGKRHRIEDTDPEIYDDRDFYQSLLRELLSEAGIDSGAVSQETGENDLRSKVNNTRQSTAQRIYIKGLNRQQILSYNVHDKLVDFMAPEPFPETSMPDILFPRLFGKKPQVNNGEDENETAADSSEESDDNENNFDEDSDEESSDENDEDEEDQEENDIDNNSFSDQSSE